jgi:hypothetical protein
MPEPALPLTVIGRWLVALLLDRRELVDLVKVRLNGGRPGPR